MAIDNTQYECDGCTRDVRDCTCDGDLMECPNCSEIELPTEGGECRNCHIPSYF